MQNHNNSPTKILDDLPADQLRGALVTFRFFRAYHNLIALADRGSPAERSVIDLRNSRFVLVSPCDQGLLVKLVPKGGAE